MDLSVLPISELRDLLKQVPLELERREVQEKVNILNDFRAIAKSHGYVLEDIVSQEVKSKVVSGGKVKVKYRHPAHPELQWTGRGRKPKWVEAWLAGGNTLDSLGV
jgi:DNA-binding protein H-NS